MGSKCLVAMIVNWCNATPCGVIVDCDVMSLILDTITSNVAVPKKHEPYRVLILPFSILCLCRA